MKSSVRWTLLVVMAGLIGGMAIWLGGDEADDATEAPPLSAHSDDSRPSMALPTANGSGNTEQASTPSALTVEPAPDLTTPEQAAPTDVPRVTVIGRLVSPHGRPVSDATISLMDGPVPQFQAAILSGVIDDEDDVKLGIGQAVSDADGSFRIEARLPEAKQPEELPAVFGDMFSSRARLLVKHPYFVTDDHPVPALFEGVVDAGTLILAEAGSLTGRVLSPSGEAVANARVAAQSATDTESLSDMLEMISGDGDHASSSARSGADGRFEIGSLPPGDYNLAVRVARHPRLLVEGVHVELGRPTSVGDLQLSSGTVLGGIVLDSEGTPVPGIKVRSTRQSPGGLAGIADLSMRLMLGESRRSNTTDEAGRFLIAGLSDDDYDVEAGGDDSGWSLTELEDVPGGARDLELVIHKLGEWLITVAESSDGPPLKGVDLVAKRVDDDEDLDVLDGKDLLEVEPAIAGIPPSGAVPAGLFLVRGAGREGTGLTLSAEGYANTHLELPPLIDASRTAHTVLLVPESAIEGIVLDDAGRPLANAEVQARSPEDTGDSPGATSKVSSTTSVSGSTDEVKKMFGIDLRSSMDATTDGNGRFRIAGLGAGDWELTAVADDFVTSEPQLVTLAAADIVRDVQLVLEAGGTIVGRVTEAGDIPVPDARIHIAVVKQGGGFSFSPEGLKENLTKSVAASLGVASAEQRTVRTGSGGRFEARGLAPGDYTVTLKKETTAPITLDLGSLFGGSPPDDGRTLHVTVVAREEVHADFVRSQRAAISVHVSAQGRSVEGANVSLNDSSSSLFGMDLSFGGNDVRTDKDGIARFEELEPATYKISASVPGALHREESRLELREGREEHVQLSFGGASLHGRVLDDSGEPVAGVPVSLERDKTDDPDDDDGGGGFLSGLLSSANVTVTTTTSGDAGDRQMTKSVDNPFGGQGESITTDEQGDFELKYISPGKWQVSAGGGPWVRGDPVTVDIDSDEAKAPDRVTVHVIRGATLTGQVIEGSTEELLDDIRVELQDMAGKKQQRTRSNNGVYVLEGVPPGDYALVIKGKDGNRARREVQVGTGGGELTVHLVTLD